MPIDIYEEERQLKVDLLVWTASSTYTTGLEYLFILRTLQSLAPLESLTDRVVSWFVTSHG